MYLLTNLLCVTLMADINMIETITNSLLQAPLNKYIVI